jgi:hypothetical protein
MVAVVVVAVVVVAVVVVAVVVVAVVVARRVRVCVLLQWGKEKNNQRAPCCRQWQGFLGQVVDAAVQYVRLEHFHPVPVDQE